jgi:hypothetical protein
LDIFYLFSIQKVVPNLDSWKSKVIDYYFLPRNMSLAKIERSLCTIQPNTSPANNNPGISIIGNTVPIKRTGSEEALPKSVNSNNSL